MSWDCPLRPLLLVAFIKQLQVTLIFFNVSDGLCDRDLIAGKGNIIFHYLITFGSEYLFIYVYYF